MDKVFTLIQRRNANGKVTVVEHKKTGHRSISLSGKCSVPKHIALSQDFSKALRSVGRIFQTSIRNILFPNFITTYDPNASQSNHKKNVNVEYDFQYAIADNIPTNKALQSVLNKNGELGELLKEKIRDIEEEYGDGQ